MEYGNLFAIKPLPIIVEVEVDHLPVVFEGGAVAPSVRVVV